MLGRLSIVNDALSPSLAEELTDLLYEIGKDQMRRQNLTEAIHWLENASNIIANQDAGSLSSDFAELRISVMHSMTKALTDRGEESDTAKAWSTIHNMSIEGGDRLAISVLKLNLYAIEAASPQQEYSDVLQKVVRTAHLTESNIRTILHHAHKLRVCSPSAAHMVLLSLVSQRLLDSQNDVWLEKTLMTMIWNCTMSHDFEDDIGSLQRALEVFATGSTIPFSPAAVHTAQIVSGA